MAPSSLYHALALSYLLRDALAWHAHGGALVKASGINKGSEQSNACRRPSSCLSRILCLRDTPINLYPENAEIHHKQPSAKLFQFNVAFCK